MRLFLAISLFVGVTHAQWTQDQFMIGAWWDPQLTGTSATDEGILQDYVDGGFNLLGGYGDLYSYRFNTTVGGRTITNQYLLNRVAAVNDSIGHVALMASVHDEIAFAAPIDISDYTGLTGGAADALFGYSVIHEPTAAALTNNLDLVEDIRTDDADRITFDVMASIWRVWNGANSFATNWTAFENYVNEYISHSSTRIVSFDYYVLAKWNGVISYSAASGDRVSYYKTLNLFAQSSSSAGKEFWGMGNANERQIDWWNGAVHDVEAFMYPTAENLRFYAYSNLVYGAKGLIWYIYDIPTTTCNPAVVTCETFTSTASNDAVIYGRLADINAEMANMGPTLMKLNWLATVHGSSTDPFSGETDLPVVTGSTPVLAHEDTHDQVAIGIYEHEDNGRNYLMIFNKDWQNSDELWFAVQGFGDAYLFDKANSTWSRLPQTISWSGSKTAFPVEFRPGDLQLIDIREGVIDALHQYWNSGLNSHYYTANYEGTNNCCGWSYDQTIGGIYNTEVTGTIPLYKYWNSALSDWYYTTNWQGTDNGYGWTYQETIGYVFGSQVDGTVPLYQYWNSSLTDHYYTTTWEGSNNCCGWAYQEIVGYVIPNN